MLHREQRKAHEQPTEHREPLAARYWGNVVAAAARTDVGRRVEIWPIDRLNDSRGIQNLSGCISVFRRHQHFDAADCIRIQPIGRNDVCVRDGGLDARRTKGRTGQLCFMRM